MEKKAKREKGLSNLETGYLFGEISISEKYELVRMSETMITVSERNFHKVMFK